MAATWEDPPVLYQQLDATSLVSSAPPLSAAAAAGASNTAGTSGGAGAPAPAPAAAAPDLVLGLCGGIDSGGEIEGASITAGADASRSVGGDNGRRVASDVEVYNSSAAATSAKTTRCAAVCLTLRLPSSRE